MWCTCWSCYHSQGEIRGWDSHLYNKNEPLGKSRPTARLSGQTQVEKRILIWHLMSVKGVNIITMWVSVSLCTTEAKVSLVMTSSALIHAAASAMTAGRSSHVDSQQTLLCCYARGNKDISKHWRVLWASLHSFFKNNYISMSIFFKWMWIYNYYRGKCMLIYINTDDG